MSGISLIIYCHIRWQSNYCREFYYALARLLDGKGQVICIDRPLAVLPDIVLRPGKLLKSLWGKRTTRLLPNLLLYQPVVFVHDQAVLSRKVLSRLNLRTLKRQVLKRFGGSIAGSTLFSYIVDPFQLDYLKVFDGETSLYDCIAEWSSYPGLSEKQRAKRRFFESRTVINKADIVFTVSRLLLERKKKIKREVYYLPWAAEYGHFVKGNGHRCGDLPKHSGPFIGFIGNIWGIFDLDLVRHIANSLPDCRLIVIGALEEKLPQGFRGKFKKLCRIENIHWLGYKDHDVLPDYLLHFDVCIMPYVVDDWINTCSPGKFYQYLAQGKPIVSVDIPEVSKYNDEDIVRIAKDYDGFVDKIKNSLREGQDESLRLKRQKVAGENTWERRASGMLEIMNRR